MADKNDAERGSPRHLSSWQEIASYFGLNVRTVQKWEREKGLPVKRLPGTRGRIYSPFYVLANFLVAPLREGSEKRVLVTSHHLTFHPNQFAVLDEKGKVLSQYWHSGHLEHLDMGESDGDGAAEIFLAGVNNGYRAAALVVLDSANISGASWQGEGSPFQLRGFEKGREKALVLFQRTCINQKFENFNKVRLLAVAGGSIKVNVAEKESDPAAEVIYTLDRNLKVVSVEFSDRLKNLHRELESKGEIDHALSAEEIERMRHVRVLGGTTPN